MFLNKAIIIGNLTRDPELRALPSGIQVASFSVATNRVWKDKNGARQESSDFHNIVVFGRQAETTAQYMKKGSSVLIEGRIQNRSWDGKDGQKHSRTEIVADRVQFGPRSGGAAGPGPSTSSGPKTADSKAGKVDTSTSLGVNPENGRRIDKGPEIATIEYPEEEINPEDIPF